GSVGRRGCELEGPLRNSLGARPATGGIFPPLRCRSVREGGVTYLFPPNWRANRGDEAGCGRGESLVASRVGVCRRVCAFFPRDSSPFCDDSPCCPIWSPLVCVTSGN